MTGAEVQTYLKRAPCFTLMVNAFFFLINENRDVIINFTLLTK